MLVPVRRVNSARIIVKCAPHLRCCFASPVDPFGIRSVGNGKSSSGLTVHGGSFSKAAIDGQVKATVGGLARQIPIGTGPTDCLVDGSIEISGNIQDPVAVAAGMLTPGDSFRVDYAACDDGAGEILDGRIDMVVGDPFTGDIISGTYVLTMDIEITNFQVRADSDVITSNGDTPKTIDTWKALLSL